MSKKQIGIDPGRQLADVTRPHQELVAGDLGIGGRLAQRGYEEFRPAIHGSTFAVQEV